jgi:ech hydrogenase subunit E
MPVTVIPFGPQHPVLAEPVQLELRVEDEVVREAAVGLGFVHRGIETEAERRTFDDDVLLLERVCGICSVAHAVAYASAVEALAGVTVPRRARLLRLLWFELTRIHSHLLWLGIAPDSIGFEALFQGCWRVRERVLDVFEATAGNRVILGVVALGGVRRDIADGDLPGVLDGLDRVAAGLDDLAPFVLDNDAVARRLTGTGVLSCADAVALGVVGPTARASGIPCDVRRTGYLAYDELPVTPVTAEAGDAMARVLVRWQEIGQSIELCRAAVAHLRGEPGPLRARVPPVLRGETVARVEAPRGELLYFVAADGGERPARVRVRTTTFANLPAVLRLLPGAQLADVPLILLSIDPCLSCTER